MFNFIKARKIFSVIFIVITLGFSIYNIGSMREKFIKAASAQTIPQSLSQARATVKSLTNLTDTTIAHKMFFVEGYGYLHMLLGKHEISNFEYVRSRNGAVRLGKKYNKDFSEFKEYAARVYRLKNAVEHRGGKMFFMGGPDAVNENDGHIFDAGMPVYEFATEMDTFYNYLREYGVDYLDIRDVLRESKIPADKIMFNTDHHWTIEASFEAFKSLVGELERRFDIELDPDWFYRDINNYTFTEKDGIFLGFYGTSTGRVYSGMDNFTWIFPNFENEYFSEYISVFPRGFFQNQGEFVGTLYPSWGMNITNPYTDSTPYLYMGGMNAWHKIRNLNNPDGPKLLLVHDSFMLPVAAFLAPMFSEIHMIWPVYNPAENSNPFDVEKYISDNTFDYVIVELYGANLKSDGVNFFINKEE